MLDVEVIADLVDACGESPIWDPGSNTLRWVDITNQTLHTLRWPNGTMQTQRLPIPVSGLALTSANSIVIAGADGVFLQLPDNTIAEIVREQAGVALGVNDCIADSHGRLLIGTTSFDGSDAYPPGSLYAVEIDGSVRTLDTGFQLANGMGFSADGKQLYLTDSAARCVYVYEYDERKGTATNRRLFVQVPPDEGLPDGLTVDAADHVWSAQWFGSCICRYHPDGWLERRIPIPAKQTSSLSFGGPDLTDIFVTSAAISDALTLAPPGYQTVGNIGGQLFHLNLGIPGKPKHRCHLQQY